MAGPGRPATDRDVFLFLNGCPNYLGVLSSTGVAVNNLTTGTPFNQTPLGPTSNPSVGPPNLTNTLAGKVLILQATVDGFILPSASSAVNIVDNSAAPAAGTLPGLMIGASERVIMMMLPTMGWMQWLPGSLATGMCFVWELL